MKNWPARWDLTPDEQAGMTFEDVLTIVNLRRVEVACLLGLLIRLTELGGAFRSIMTVVQLLLTTLVLLASLAMRRSSNIWLIRCFVAFVLVAALLGSQAAVAVLSAQGRLTGGYLTMLLSLALLFVLPPRLVALGSIALFPGYCLIVLGTPAPHVEKVVAIQNAALVSVIAVVAASLIHAGRRRDYEQKRAILVQNDELRDRNDELDTLMAITAHDLRSPLYGLRNLFDLTIRRAPQDPDLPLVVLRQAMTSVDAMLALATRLLDAHAAEHRPIMRLVDEDVRGHILAAVGRIGPLAQFCDVRIDVDLPDRPLVTMLEAGALAQMLDNLLSNGVRFSPAGGTLAIGVARKGHQVEITIRDQGPGIEPARRDLLFKKFHRGAGARTDGVFGTGMGLFIVATLAERMKATVSYEPVTGGGSAFVMSLAAR